MNDVSHNEMKEFIASYVLGAVDDEEQAMVRAHILSCEECMREADELTQVTSWLEGAVEPVDVPDGFADRVLQTVHASEQENAPAQVASVTPLRRRASPITWLSAAAALVAIAVLSFSLVQTRGELNDRDRVLSAVVRGDAMKMTGSSGAVARMVPTSDGGLLVASGLGDVPEDHTYQLWLMEGDKPVSAGVFEAEDGLVTFEVDGSLEGVDGVAVTVEPDGGSPKPTGDPVLST